MRLQPRGHDKIVHLIERGVNIPNPLSLDVGEEVDITRISSDRVTIYPGCRIYGAKTVISAGVKLGAEGPVTIEDCRLGPGVELKGGYFRQSVLLEKAGMGLGAQLREGCLLEEEANGAHCVGLKQTILFPFVTLGSLINFCDCLMAGGTSRTDHSEVGSSYIHFNYTPDGDKTTASLFGDVPRGVMLNQPPIFLGGQGSAVGPVRVGYGTVVVAGSILRHDVLDDGRLVAVAPPVGFEREHHSHNYSNLPRVVRNNIIYLANLVALEEWYRNVRWPFFARQEMGDLIYEGALEVLVLARRERVKRLLALADKVPARTPVHSEFCERAPEICALFGDRPPVPDTDANGTEFLAAVASAASEGEYIQVIQGLATEASARGVRWLQRIVSELVRRGHELLPALGPAEDKP